MADDHDEILLVPFFGQGHLFPCIELCKHLSSRQFKTTLIITSALSSSIPSSVRHHRLIQITEIIESQESTPPVPTPPGPFGKRHEQMKQGIESLISTRPEGSRRPVCAIVDVMMSWSKETFWKFDIPVVSFFTSGACAAAIEYASWKAGVDDVKPGEIRIFPGLPEEMALSYPELQRRNRHRPSGAGPGGPPLGGAGPGGPPLGGAGPGGPSLGGAGPGGPPLVGAGPGGQAGPGPMKPFGPGFKGPPKPGQQPPWIAEVDGTIAILMNTCQDLEGPFIDYVANQIGKPVFGVGPLLPEEYWNSGSSLLRDGVFRPKKQSNFTEEEVIQWLDSKPPNSVLYVSFGSEVGPTVEEYGELRLALEESNHPFIWVIQRGSGRPHGPPPTMFGGVPDEGGYYPDGLQEKVGERGVIIRGWAPQLLILSHPSTGGFLSHCGWNSTVEAIGRGVPFLAWPIRGDQYFDAKLVVDHLKVGYMVLERELSELVKKEDIVKGIDRLMGDGEVKRRAAVLRSKFQQGFPASSELALDAFRNNILQ